MLIIVARRQKMLSQGRQIDSGVTVGKKPASILSIYDSTYARMHVMQQQKLNEHESGNIL